MGNDTFSSPDEFTFQALLSDRVRPVRLVRMMPPSS